MRPTFDAKDEGILAKREELFNQRSGPRVGDYVIFPDEHTGRFSHDWGESIQTTDGRYGQSFYLGNGYADFSGGLNPSTLRFLLLSSLPIDCQQALAACTGLNPSIPKSALMDTGKPMRGTFWFFHHDMPGAYRGVRFSIACRVFRYSLAA